MTSDPKWKDITCKYCGNIESYESAWASDVRCGRCWKWMILTTNNEYEKEMTALENEFKLRREVLNEKYERLEKLEIMKNNSYLKLVKREK